MKQKRLKEILKLKLLLLCCLTLFWQCQNDFEEDNVNTHQLNSVNESNVSFRMLTGKDAKNKAELLKSTINKNHNLDTGMAYRETLENNTNGTIDYENILEVIDTSGVTNYTFKVINHPEDSETVFHNLVLSDDGTEQKVTLIKYKYQNNATKIENFEGIISTRDLSSEEPCDETNIDGNFNTGNFNPSSGSGSSSGATYPDYPGSGTTDTGDTGSSGSGSGGSGFLTVSDQPATFHCNSCNFSAYSWEGYSGHTDGLGNIYDFTIIFNMGRMADLNPDPNPCDSSGAIGIIDLDKEEGRKRECKKITNFLEDEENQAFKQKLNELSSNTNLDLDYEKGATMSENESDITTYQGNPDEPEFTMTALPTNKYKAFVHTHPAIGDGTLSVFSPEDLYPDGSFTSI